jgi:hypothetical protein
MPRFFVSYTSPDEAWAEWISAALEDDGYEVVVQKWDFAAGSNFVLEMHKAAAGAERTIAVLSPDYLTGSDFGAAEWAAALANDPASRGRSLVPVRARECKTDGLLKPIVYIDLVGLDEDAARSALLDGVKGERLKPAVKPSFPGSAKAAHPFPGGTDATPLKDSSLIPMREAAALAYSEVEGTEIEEFVCGNYKTAEERISYFEYALLTFPCRFYGKHIPSPVSREIAGDILRRLHPVAGKNELTSDFASESQRYIEVDVNREDFDRYVRECLLRDFEV